MHLVPVQDTPTVPPWVAFSSERTFDTCVASVGGFVVDGTAADDEHAPKHRPALTIPMIHRAFKLPLPEIILNSTGADPDGPSAYP